jgi:hypothetical protein
MALSGNREGGSPRARITQFAGHNHTWREGDARTSVDRGHSHRVVLGRVQRNPNDGHLHTIGEEIKELESIRDSGVPSFFGMKGGRREAPGSV